MEQFVLKRSSKQIVQVHVFNWFEYVMVGTFARRQLNFRVINNVELIIEQIKHQVMYFIYYYYFENPSRVLGKKWLRWSLGCVKILNIMNGIGLEWKQKTQVILIRVFAIIPS